MREIAMWSGFFASILHSQIKSWLNIEKYFDICFIYQNEIVFFLTKVHGSKRKWISESCSSRFSGWWKQQICFDLQSINFQTLSCWIVFSFLLLLLTATSILLEDLPVLPFAASCPSDCVHWPPSAHRHGATRARAKPRPPRMAGRVQTLSQ